jgi:ribosomal protein S18 acetylase RimI-like enzyme
MSNYDNANHADFRLRFPDYPDLQGTFEDIIFEEAQYSSEIAAKCLSAFASELSTRLNSGFDLENSGDPDLSQMQHPHGTFVVAKLGDMPLGCVGIKGNGDAVAEVKRMWIAPAARGLGLARRLMITAENAARALSITTLRLDTNSTLFEAVNLYQNMGWVEIDRFNDDPFPDMFFEKKL